MVEDAHDPRPLDPPRFAHRPPLPSGRRRRFAARPTHPAEAAKKAPAADLRAAPPRPFVMLDPGHGGKDPGAIGITGTYEKHIAFAAATELKRQLEAAGLYRVELTRQRDVFIPLEERVGIAQHKGAALFVSMHADAIADPRRARRQHLYSVRHRVRRADRRPGPAGEQPPTASPARPSTASRRKWRASWQPGAPGNPRRVRPAAARPGRGAGSIAADAAKSNPAC